MFILRKEQNVLFEVLTGDQESVQLLIDQKLATHSRQNQSAIILKSSIHCILVLKMLFVVYNCDTSFSLHLNTIYQE